MCDVFCKFSIWCDGGFVWEAYEKYFAYERHNIYEKYNAYERHSTNPP